MTAAVASLRYLARVLGGEVVRGAVLAPGPGHSRTDRSLSVKLSADSPDGFLAHSFAGDDFRDCRDHIRERLGIRFEPTPRIDRPPRPAVPDASDEARIERAVAIWNDGRDPRRTIVERYLAGRSLPLDDIVSVAALRFHPSCPWRDEARQETIRVPAMLAAMRRIDGDRITAVHRTRLTPEGLKVDRRMLGIAAGATVKLDADESLTLGLAVGEGIETTLAGRMLGFRPAWAMGSAGGIAKLPVLTGVEALTILTERDETGANDRATNECASRWHDAGREVVLVEPRAGKDVNDAIRSAG